MKFAPAPVLLAAVFAGFACAAHAVTEYGTVVSSTPVIGQVPSGERVCTDELVQSAPRTSGAGAVAGALIGGAVGNTIGAGVGRAAATGLGLVLGSAIGNQAEANAAGPAVSTVQNCRVVNRYDDRVIGYDVVYDYNGQRRTARLPQDPGKPGTKIALEVNVEPSGAAPSGRNGRPVPPANAAPRVYSGSDDEVDAGAPPPRVVYAPYYYTPAPVYVAPAPAYYYGYPAATVWIGGRWGHHRRW